MQRRKIIKSDKSPPKVKESEAKTDLQNHNNSKQLYIFNLMGTAGTIVKKLNYTVAFKLHCRSENSVHKILPIKVIKNDGSIIQTNTSDMFTFISENMKEFHSEFGEGTIKQCRHPPKRNGYTEPLKIFHFCKDSGIENRKRANSLFHLGEEIYYNIFIPHFEIFSSKGQELRKTEFHLSWSNNTFHFQSVSSKPSPLRRNNNYFYIYEEKGTNVVNSNSKQNVNNSDTTSKKLTLKKYSIVNNFLVRNDDASDDSEFFNTNVEEVEIELKFDEEFNEFMNKFYH